MDLRRVLDIVSAACEAAHARWTVIGGVAMNAYGHARATYDFDVASEDERREEILRRLRDDGFRVLNDVPAFSNLLHPNREVGRLDLLWFDEDAFERIYSKTWSLETNLTGKVRVAKETDPGSLPWEDYFKFLKQFTPTREQLEALPLSPDVPPFRLD